jgi:transposase
MGALSSVVISREICHWQRFNNRRQVSSYTGLCPGEYSSGTKRLTGSITKHGNSRLRAALVELAWRMVRYHITPCKSDSPCWQKEPKRPGRSARKPLSP